MDERNGVKVGMDEFRREKKRKQQKVRMRKRTGECERAESVMLQATTTTTLKVDYATSPLI